MFVPHYGSDPRSFNLTLRTLYLSVSLMVILFTVFITALSLWGSHYGFMLTQMEELDRMRTVNEIQGEQILSLAAEADLISEKMKNIEELDREVRNLLELEDFQDVMPDIPQSKPVLLSRGVDYTLDSYQETAVGAAIEENASLHNQLDQLSGVIPVTRAALEDLKELIEEKKEELAGTPSIWPTTGRITSPFGERRRPYSYSISFHSGIDIGAKRGTPVYATARGVVETASYNGGMGRMVSIKHPYGHRTIYAHLTSYVVESGDPVEKGDVIGHVGSTGFSTGPHLHYEVHVNEETKDPMLFLPEKE